MSAGVDWLENYMEAENAATGSTIDANANVTNKTVATMDAELPKGIKVQIYRHMMSQRIAKKYGDYYGRKYIEDIESHLIYVHDETSVMPYCVSITMFPFMQQGMAGLGNSDGSDAPNHLRSFCGSFVNMVQYVAGQFAGAVATVEFLMCFDYFARKDFGGDYLNTHKNTIEQELQGVVYLLNQDSSARNGQSVFWNISIFDRHFFEGILGNSPFPDGSFPKWENVDKIQRFWLKWFREERCKKFLTFPIVTSSALVDDKDWIDTEYKQLIAKELSLGSKKFIYTSTTVDSLSSCCRLRSKLGTNRGVATGSVNVITLNVNRCIQTGESIHSVVNRINRYNTCFMELYEELQDRKMIPVYSAGLISLKKQFLTVGINGVVEAAEFLGINPSNNKEYTDWLKSLFSEISSVNDKHEESTGYRRNTEVVPAENLGVKNAKWDKDDGLLANRDVYNSYLYIVEDRNNILDLLTLHGGDHSAMLGGGQAVHWNRKSLLSYSGYMNVLKMLAETKCSYFTDNVKETCCNSCKKNFTETHSKCPECGSVDIDYATRIVGYIKKEKAFSAPKKIEASKRDYSAETL